MWDDEKAHLRKMKSLMIENRVRPTVLLPFWNIAGFALGIQNTFFIYDVTLCNIKTSSQDLVIIILFSLWLCYLT